MRMFRRATVAAATTLLILAIAAPFAHAGEVTGTEAAPCRREAGTGLHARPVCAYSGQEDLQYFTDDGTERPRSRLKGDPARAVWGQIPKAVRDSPLPRCTPARRATRCDRPAEPSHRRNSGSARRRCARPRVGQNDQAAPQKESPVSTRARSDRLHRRRRSDVARHASCRRTCGRARSVGNAAPGRPSPRQRREPRRVDRLRHGLTAPTTPETFLTIAYDAGTGEQLWAKTYGGGQQDQGHPRGQPRRIHRLRRRHAHRRRGHARPRLGDDRLRHRERRRPLVADIRCPAVDSRTTGGRRRDESQRTASST
jgi:hypothetical protein